ncbi:TonB-dependent receptor [Neiella marina]|uniref:TonB-dependent receptor n=1 Tax=Neiella holothuriorum TaxID=2870530 RepID=A0ABS7EG60_9GAMM|nr:TonB-dependent receptor [Neiella holothuriorum]MBW8190913.1 TonB-dependent receptor [Neiella holothuriorum]
MFASNKLAAAVRYAVFGAAAASTAAAIPAYAEDAGADDAERIQVTGSRIKRTDMEGSSPVSIIDMGEVAKAGEFSIADMLRNSNLNTFGSFSESSGSTWQSQSNINLRGAGAERTLVLINGRRLPGSPTMGGTAVNLNTIPTAAIERIEVLTDGASAVYGSDAVAGVVNIITKRDYDGAEISATLTSPDQEGGDEWKAHAVAGITGDKGSATVSIEHLSRDIIYQRDRWYSRATGHDATDYGDTTGISVYARNFLDFTAGQFAPMAACDNEAMAGGGNIYDWGDGDFVCGYDYTSEAADHADRDYTAGYLSADYEISSDVSMNVMAMFTRNETFGRYAPAAGWFNVGAGQVALTPGYNAPTDENGNNLNAGRVYYRFTDVGTRDTTVVDYTTDIQVGFTGELEGYTWDVSYHYNKQDNQSTGTGYVHRPTIETLVADGEWNFGPEGNDEATVASIAHQTTADNVMDFHMWNAGVSFEAFDLPAGTVGWYFGAEYIDYDYTSTVDAESAAGEIIGSSGNGSGGSRDVTAFFGEAAVPVLENLELSIALRYDDYSDFGDNVAPKVAARYEPMDGLIVRASYGEGFRAPALSDLYAADSFSADDATDYHYCEVQGTSASDCDEEQYDVTRQSNEDLDAEDSSFYNIGVVWDVTENFNAGLEYYNLEVEDVITFVSLDALLKEEAEVGYGNLALGEVLRLNDNPDGKILEATTPQVNGNKFETSGLDLTLNYHGLATSFGEFGSNLDLTYVLNYDDEEYYDGPVNDKIGRNGLPEMRFTWKVDWEMNNHSAYISAQYIDSQAETEDPETYEQIGHLGSQTTWDASYSYATPWNATATMGVRNLTDRDPILDSNLQYDSDLYSIYGRTYFATYTQKF